MRDKRHVKLPEYQPIRELFPELADAIEYPPVFGSSVPRFEMDVEFLAKQFREQDKKYIIGGDQNEN